MTGKGRSGNSGKGGPVSAGKVAMTQVRAAVIQSKTMKTTGTVNARSFAARVQSAADKNVNAGIVPATPTPTP